MSEPEVLFNLRVIQLKHRLATVSAEYGAAMTRMAELRDSHDDAVREFRRARQQLWIALALAGVAFGSGLTLAAAGIRTMPDQVPTTLSAMPGLADAPAGWLPDAEPPGTAAGEPPLFRLGPDGWPAGGLRPVPEECRTGRRGARAFIDTRTAG